VPEGSAAEHAAALLPDSRVVAAFHHVSAVLLLDPEVESMDLDVLVLGDDRAATDLVQALAARLPETPVFPALNTLFIGETAERGLWLENCRGCGNCMLGLTGGICPVSRCAKSLMNGPCGGARNGLCEINLAKEIIPEVPCAWLQIYDRLLALGELDRLMELAPPKDWSCGDAAGPRRVLRPDQQA